MNKSEFIKELSKQTRYDEERCKIINDVIEDTFFIGKKNKEKMLTSFIEKLNINEDEANKIYESAMQIIGIEVKEKLRHPFKSQD